jgi:hypothetical protein
MSSRDGQQSVPSTVSVPKDRFPPFPAQNALRAVQKAELVELRYFLGLTTEQTGRVLNISEPTAKRWWANAKAWLSQACRESGTVQWGQPATFNIRSPSQIPAHDGPVPADHNPLLAN